MSRWTALLLAMLIGRPALAKPYAMVVAAAACRVIYGPAPEGDWPFWPTLVPQIRNSFTGRRVGRQVFGGA
jgi:hypothetical protein